jgi:DNA-binding transcriptional regulator YiaG
MKQSDVAKLLGCTTQTIRFWEWDRFKPRHQQMTKLVAFLGFDPLPGPTDLGEKIVRFRQHHGLTQRGLAEKMGVDPSSIWAWETGEHKPSPKSASLIEKLLEE